MRYEESVGEGNMNRLGVVVKKEKLDLKYVRRRIE